MHEKAFTHGMAGINVNGFQEKRKGEYPVMLGLGWVNTKSF
jgi:hypothetical protein